MATLNLKNTFATFADPKMAEKAGGALLDYGVKPEHLSIVLPEGYGSPRDLISGGGHLEHEAKTGITTTTAGDAEKGSVKGAEIGLAAGALTALMVVFLPGVGIVLGGGALAFALAGVAGTSVAGAIAGGLTGFLKDQGVAPDAISAYDEAIVNGGAVITVSPIREDTDFTTIQAVLRKYGGNVTSYPMVPSTTSVPGIDLGMK